MTCGREGCRCEHDDATHEHEHEHGDAEGRCCGGHGHDQGGDREPDEEPVRWRA